MEDGYITLLSNDFDSIVCELEMLRREFHFFSPRTISLEERTRLPFTIHQLRILIGYLDHFVVDYGDILPMMDYLQCKDSEWFLNTHIDGVPEWEKRRLLLEVGRSSDTLYNLNVHSIDYYESTTSLLHDTIMGMARERSDENTCLIRGIMWNAVMLEMKENGTRYTSRNASPEPACSSVELRYIDWQDVLAFLVTDSSSQSYSYCHLSWISGFNSDTISTLKDMATFFLGIARPTEIGQQSVMYSQSAGGRGITWHVSDIDYLYATSLHYIAKMTNRENALEVIVRLGLSSLLERVVEEKPSPPRGRMDYHPSVRRRKLDYHPSVSRRRAASPPSRDTQVDRYSYDVEASYHHPSEGEDGIKFASLLEIPAIIHEYILCYYGEKNKTVGSRRHTHSGSDRLDGHAELVQCMVSTMGHQACRDIITVLSHHRDKNVDLFLHSLKVTIRDSEDMGCQLHIL
jgi:hypothetical protein